MTIIKIIYIIFTSTIIFTLFKNIIRIIMKPKIEIKFIPGELKQVEYKGDKLYTRRKVTLWIQNIGNKTLNCKSVTFRRICRFQKKCMIFKYLQKTKAISIKDWCPCSSVTDWEYPTTFKQPTHENEKKIITKFAQDGKLTLIPFNNTLSPGNWQALEVPLFLRTNKSHIVEITLSFKIKL